MTDELHLLGTPLSNCEGTFKISGSSLQANLEATNRMILRVTSWGAARQEVSTTYRAKDQMSHPEVRTLTLET